ncbi:MAG: S-layer homology domain-containing protein [Clostridia bacterium]|nr:S-layer homology domain-containing protein [Clostridia bacterium]
MKKLTALVLTVLMLLSITVGAAPSGWANEEVNAATEMGIVPDRIQSYYQNPITREEFCEMVMLMFDKIAKEEIAAAEDVFADTDNASVLRAYAAGIVKGTGETTFSPEASITRQEICTMLTRAILKADSSIALAESYPNTFPDRASIADWALLNVQYMNMNTIMLGDEAGNINPLGNTTREQAILLTYRLVNSLNKKVDNAILSMFMSSSGNTQCNMLCGAFAIYRDGTIYVSDGNNVRAINGDSQEVIVAEGASRILSLTGELYYIKKADSKIYKKELPAGVETLLCDKAATEFAAINDKIFFVAADGVVYSVSNKGGEATAYEHGCIQTPISAGADMFVTDGASIAKIAKDGTKTTIYTGANKKVSVRNQDVYFIDGESYLCKVAKGSTSAERVSKIQIKDYCTELENIIVLSTSGEAYKLDYKGLYTIKIDFDSYENINTYNDNVYGKKATGEVVTFKTDSTGKAAM